MSTQEKPWLTDEIERFIAGEKIRKPEYFEFPFKKVFESLGKTLQTAEIQRLITGKKILKLEEYFENLLKNIYESLGTILALELQTHVS